MSKVVFSKPVRNAQDLQEFLSLSLAAAQMEPGHAGLKLEEIQILPDAEFRLVARLADAGVVFDIQIAYP